MKKKIAIVISAIFIFFSGCSSPQGSKNIRVASSSGSGSSYAQKSALETVASDSSESISVRSDDQISSNLSASAESSNSKIDISNEGSQIDISGSNTPDIPRGECLEPYHIGFNIQNLSTKPISKIFIRAINLGGCAVDVDESQDQLPLNKNYAGAEWVYTGIINPSSIGLCGFYVIPKQLQYQTLTFQFYMADGKTPFKNANNNPVNIKVRFGIKDGDDIPVSEPINSQDIDIGGKLVFSQDNQQYFIVFTINNEAFFNDLNGIMLKIPASDYKGYKMEAMQGGNVSLENGDYVWEMPQMLARRMAENITISCPFDKVPPSGFDFYTLDGKTKIDTCKISS